MIAQHGVVDDRMSTLGAGGEDRGIHQIFYDDLVIVGEDGLAFLLAPLSFDRCDWLRLGGVAAGAAGLMLVDERMQDIPRKNQNPTLRDAASALNWGGDLQAAEIATGIVYLGGLFAGQDEIRITGRMLAQTLIYSGSAFYAVAVVAGRSRPYALEGAHEFDFWQFDNASQSFPSGHTVVAFSVATVMASRLDHWAASVLLYGAAAGVSLGRMYQDFHWASDIFLGAVIGYSAGKFVQHRENERRGGGEAAMNWDILPTGNGLAFQLRF
jgi:hypothetical protein